MKRVKTKYYEFKYMDVKYKTEIGCYMEILRYHEYRKISNEIMTRLRNTTMQKIARTTVNKIITKHIIHNLSKYGVKLLKDPMFHSSGTDDIIDDIIYNFDVSRHRAKLIVKNININELFERASDNLLDSKNNHRDAYEKTYTMINSSDGVIFTPLDETIKKLYIPNEIYNRLCKRYREYKRLNPHSYKFDDLIFILLLRYHTFDSGGQQWGMPIKVRKRFKRCCSFDFECFASSLNHYYTYYCSIFYDIEKYFMSIGFFQNVEYKRGNFMANPPYELNLLKQMYCVITQSIKQNNHKLLFLFGLPGWDRYDDKKSFIKKFKNNKYTKYIFRLPPYQYKWHDFMTRKIKNIPQSYRIVMSKNKDSELIDAIDKANIFWGDI